MSLKQCETGGAHGDDDIEYASMNTQAYWPGCVSRETQFELFY